MSIGIWMTIMLVFGVVGMGLCCLSLKVCEKIYRLLPVLVRKSQFDK